MATVTAYTRPSSMTYLLELLERPGAVLLGGGTRLGLWAGDEPIEVLDLQALHLDGIEAEDNRIIGQENHPALGSSEKANCRIGLSVVTLE